MASNSNSSLYFKIKINVKVKDTYYEKILTLNENYLQYTSTKGDPTPTDAKFNIDEIILEESKKNEPNNFRIVLFMKAK